jgi:aspartyl-tRNA(Asn)/glutamyl-tRNA(Gln) amidotransferase subunit B
MGHGKRKMAFETVIGLEVHSQLLTRSKMYCSCAADYASTQPNSRVCPVCLGMPGVLPVINRKAVELTIMTGLALSCTISEHTKFDRKNYPYPDLVKGYQISQYDAPIATSGWLDVDANGISHRIGIHRVHLEEDTAKLLHRPGMVESHSLVDVNRSGVPLMEIVSQPDMRSPEEARQYLIKLRVILQYLGVSTGNMEEGSFRCDANISLRLLGAPLPQAKVEVKNMNSFRAVFRALTYEEERLGRLMAAGGRLTQETRGWVEERGETVLQRTKEEAHDYRYFPEPDLPPLEISTAYVEELRARLPELPDSRRQRYINELELSDYDAGLVTQSRHLADFFEQAIGEDSALPMLERAKKVANWLLGDFTRLVNATGMEIPELPLTPAHLMELVNLVEAGRLSGPAAKQVMEEMFGSGGSPAQIMAQKGLEQMGRGGELETAVAQAIQANPQPVADYRKGKAQAITFLVGQVMRSTRGRANPQQARDVMIRMLEESS